MLEKSRQDITENNVWMILQNGQSQRIAVHADCSFVELPTLVRRLRYLT